MCTYSCIEQPTIVPYTINSTPLPQVALRLVQNYLLYINFTFQVHERIRDVLQQNFAP